jgi:hypothetical protein
MKVEGGQLDTLLKGSEIKALHNSFLHNVRQLRCLGTLEWTYPSGEREDLQTYVFPSDDPELILAPADWKHYVSVLLNVPDRVVVGKPEVETNTPMLELYLPKGKPTWRPNFVFCSGGGGRVELRCYGKFKVGARGSPAAKFFLFIRQTKTNVTLKRDRRGKEYASFGSILVGQSGDWQRFWRKLAAFSAVVRAYKQH